MPKQPKKAPFRLTPADEAQIIIFSETFDQVEEMPVESQWAMLFELLPESFLRYTIGQNGETRDPDGIFSYASALAMEALMVFVGQDFLAKLPPPALANLMMFTLTNIMKCCFGEMEKRHRYFGVQVVFPESPTPIHAPDTFEMFLSEDPDFHEEALFSYYRQLCQQSAK